MSENSSPDDKTAEPSGPSEHTSSPTRNDEQLKSEESSKASPEALTDREQTAGEPSRQECVVVGIGASAGGLNAYKLLLSHLPGNAGIAYVLVPHLDPSHESMMVELLAKYTPMPVRQVNDPTVIQPDHVYMIPPNRFIKIHDGGLFLDEPVTQRGVRLPIDYFFHSLAEARRERAICVVLTGTGSDGASGVREVKAQGGMTIVQKPETAEYDGMPRAAVNTGDVDFVLPIEEMADVIVPYARHPYVKSPREATLAESAPDHFRAIISLLRAHTDQDFSHYKKGTLTRRIDRRMGIRQIDNPADYLKLLRENNEELRLLFKDLLLGVTCFFRDPQAWDDLSDILTRKILDKQNEEPIRIWVPGCSTGEEAYSIAMLVFEQQLRQNRRLDVQVFGTDLDSDSIDAARLGVYPENIAKDIPASRLDAYCQREGDKFRVRKKLREVCIFAVQNLLSDPPFSGLDLICCRNLLIYLQPEVQRRIFDMFHFALKPEGLLFLGSSESPTQRRKLFETLSQSSRIYQKSGESKPGAGGIPLENKGTRSVAAATGGDSELPTPRDVGTAELSKRTLLEQYAPASVVVDQRGTIQYIHGSMRDFLDFPSGEPELNLTAIALDGLKARIRKVLSGIRASNDPISVVAPRVERNGEFVSVRIQARAIPTAKSSTPLFLISFMDEPSGKRSAPESQSDANQQEDADTSQDAELTQHQLALELQATREDLQSTIEELESANEELKASNEEVMSMNEELQSTNEELETSREELQSLNEELSTVNNQLHDKVEELEAMTNDLMNLLSSTDLATLFLDSDLRIRRFTPATTRLMSIIDTDVGRPISDLSPRVNDPDLVADAREVLEQLTPIQKEVQNGGEKWYTRRITPFRTSDNKIEGVVVTYSDVTDIKKSAQRIEFREQQAAAVAQLGKLALSSGDLDTLFARTVDEIARTLGVEFSKILALEPGGRELRLVAGVGWDEGLIGEATVGCGIESQAGFTLQTFGPIIVEDLSKDKRFTGPSLLTDHGIVSGMSVTIGPESNPWGVLGAHSKHATSFTIDDTNFMLAIAHVLWEAIRRHSIEAELRDQQAKLSSFMTNSAVAGWMKDVDGKYVYWSESCVEIFGIASEQILGRTDEEIFPAEIADRLRENDRKVRETDESLETIEEVIDASGTIRQYVVSKFPFTDSSGKQHVGGLGVDITDRIHAERALSISEERLRFVTDRAHVGFWHWDLKTDSLDWSESCKQLFGIPLEEEMSYQRFLDALHPDDRERTDQAVQACLNGFDDGEYDIEYRAVMPEGDIRWIHARGSATFENGQASKMAGIAMEVTSRKQIEEQLFKTRQAAEAANEAKSIFLANMSHEIRSPLTAILGYADVLQSRTEDGDAQACIKTIKENGAYLCDLLNDILDLSKIESGKYTVRLEDTSIIKILADIRSLMTVRATEKSLTLIIEFDGELPATIHTDPKLVRQILVNLVGNAIKFTEHGSVRILAKCLAEEELLEISVIDTGIGIDEKDQQTLFLPFEQLDNSFTRTAEGSGLGLAISQKLVRMLGGELAVDSTLNEGSTFRFTIQTGDLGGVEWISPDPGALREEVSEASLNQLPELEGRVFAADDRREIIFLIRQFLQQAGAEVESFENGADCVEAWLELRGSRDEVDAILMDIRMPVMDGLEATRKLRAEGFRGPIIALTANAMRRDRENCLEAGCDDFLSKPIDRTELITKLAHWINKQKLKNDRRSSEKMSILTVDDNEATCMSLRILLEKQGYKVQTATSGDEALRRLKSFTPDVALIDLGLKEMSGSELLQQLKIKPELANCRFVCLSGREEEDVEWYEMGFHRYLKKPADIEQIESAIQSARDNLPDLTTGEL